jgi:uncharacterized protein (DUF885 family)
MNLGIGSRICALLLVLCFVASAADNLSEFSESFWKWRATEQPFTEDDIPRIERPADFAVNWSPSVVQQRRRELAEFEQRWNHLKPAADAPVPQQVDYRLLGSALARVRWELDIEQAWKRNPKFYVDQSLGAMYVLLLPPPPFSPERQRQLISRLESVPATLRAAQENLTDMRQPFATLAIDSLNDVAGRMLAMLNAIAPHLTKENNRALSKAAEAAVPALNQYRAWLQTRLPAMRQDTAVGREKYLYFLRNVALLPYSPEQLLAMSRQELNRSFAFESYEKARDADLPALPLFPSEAAQISQERLDEEEIRALLTKQQLLTVPAWMKHYRNWPLPDYVAPFQDLGVTDDLTGPSRLDQDGTSYIREPSPNLGFFYRSTAQDPRPIVVHEGVPGHYFQLTLAWANPDPIRRHYYDSGANEGIGFYAEEMMLQAGLFDNKPKAREIIYNFMRLRALRVEVDVKLALGIFTLQQAAHYLSETVPMDRASALEEAANFASTPGQAITYQVGKIQITDLLADARRAQGNQFSLLKFNDFVWTNGNVPIALQRWEMLGDGSEVPVALPVPK